MSTKQKKLSKKYKELMGEDIKKEHHFKCVLPKSKNDEQAGTLDNDDDFVEDDYSLDDKGIIEIKRYNTVESKNDNCVNDEEEKEVQKIEEIVKRKDNRNYNHSKTEYKENTTKQSCSNNQSNKSSIFECISSNYIMIIVGVFLLYAFGGVVFGVASSLISMLFSIIQPILKYGAIIVVGMYLYSKLKDVSFDKKVNTKPYNKSHNCKSNNYKKNNTRRNSPKR